MKKLIFATLIVMVGIVLGADQKGAEQKDPAEHEDKTPPPALTGMEAGQAQFEHYSDVETVDKKFQYYSRLKNLSKSNVLTAKWEAGGVGLSEIMPGKPIVVTHESTHQWHEVNGEVLYTPGLNAVKKDAHAYQTVELAGVVPPEQQMASVHEQPALTSRIYADLRGLGTLDISFISSVSRDGEKQATFRLLNRTPVSLSFRIRKLTDRLKEIGSPGRTWKLSPDQKDAFALPAGSARMPGEALMTVRADEFEDEAATLEILATDGHAYTSGTVTAYLPTKKR